MCPQFPEPVPLQHPIAPLKTALEKVSVSGCSRARTSRFGVGVGVGFGVTLTDGGCLETGGRAPEVKRSRHQAAGRVGHRRPQRFCPVERQLWQEEHQRPVLLRTQRVHGVQVRHLGQRTASPGLANVRKLCFRPWRWLRRTEERVGAGLLIPSSSSFPPNGSKVPSVRPKQSSAEASITVAAGSRVCQRSSPR